MSTANQFADFTKTTAEEWLKIIEKELKGKSIDSLVTATPEGISIQPFYHSDTVESATHNIPNPVQLDNPGLPVRFWVNQYKVVVKDLKKANSEALWALNSGADGIIFQVESSITDFDLLLKEIQPEYCMISFESSQFDDDLPTGYLKYLNSKHYDPEKITGAYFSDVLENRDAGILDTPKPKIKQLKGLIEISSKFPHFKVFHVSAQLYHNAGANIIHEMSFTLSKLVEYLDLLTEEGLTPDQIFKALSFGFAFGRHYFFEIAKIKVFKAMILKIASAYKYDLSANDIIIHANTGSRSKSALDINVNLLRNSTEAMSAILSGCNSLYVAPHDALRQGSSKITFKRIALNVSSILKEEAYLDKIVDPTLGTYYLENLIKEMQTNAWDHFINIEEHGSYSDLFQQGLIQQSIEKDEEASSKLVTERKDLLIGANTFQLIGEVIPQEEKAEKRAGFLSPKRITHQIESLRGRTEKYVNKHGDDKRPMAGIILLDNDPVSKAKSNFAYSFLGMAGIGIQEEVILQDINQLTKTIKDMDTEMVVICYNEKPKDLLQKLGEADSRILIAGQESNEEQMKQAGIYACIHRKTPSLEFLNQLLTELGI